MFVKTREGYVNTDTVFMISETDADGFEYKLDILHKEGIGVVFVHDSTEKEMETFLKSGRRVRGK